MRTRPIPNEPLLALVADDIPMPQRADGCRGSLLWDRQHRCWLHLVDMTVCRPPRAVGVAQIQAAQR